MDLQQLVILAIRSSILLTVFGLGLDASLEDVLHLVRRPSLLTRSLLAMFVIMPIVAVGLALAFKFLPTVETALVALALSPVPPLLPQKQSKAGGHASYALGLMATAALLSIAIVPVSVWILGQYLSKPFAISPGSVANIVVMTALLPLVVGMFVRALVPAVAQRLARPVALVARVLLSVGAVAILGASLSAITALIGNGTLIAMTVFVLVGLAVGHLLGGPSPDDRIVLALSTACRHPGIALAIGSAASPGQRLGPTILLYLVVNAVVCIPYITWQRRQKAATLSATMTRAHEAVRDVADLKRRRLRRPS